MLQIMCCTLSSKVVYSDSGRPTGPLKYEEKMFHAFKSWVCSLYIHVYTVCLLMLGILRGGLVWIRIQIQQYACIRMKGITRQIAYEMLSEMIQQPTLFFHFKRIAVPFLPLKFFTRAVNYEHY
jgi:hypothetical protein